MNLIFENGTLEIIFKLFKKQGKYEFSLFLFGDINENEIKIYDLYLPKQENRQTTTEIDEIAVNQMVVNKIEYFTDLRSNPRFVGWLHSHNSMGAFWSSTDRNQINALKKNFPEFIAIVISKMHKKKKTYHFDYKCEYIGEIWKKSWCETLVPIALPFPKFKKLKNENIVKNILVDHSFKFKIPIDLALIDNKDYSSYTSTYTKYQNTHKPKAYVKPHYPVIPETRYNYGSRGYQYDYYNDFWDFQVEQVMRGLTTQQEVNEALDMLSLERLSNYILAHNRDLYKLLKDFFLGDKEEPKTQLLTNEEPKESKESNKAEPQVLGQEIRAWKPYGLCTACTYRHQKTCYYTIPKVISEHPDMVILSCDDFYETCICYYCVWRRKYGSNERCLALSEEIDHDKIECTKFLEERNPKCQI